MTLDTAMDQVEPFFFGPLQRRLYGCYHEPAGWPSREQGVLICYPFGQEYIRAHRACRHLAAQVARAGFPAMRFDYFGTGDSAGTTEAAGLEQWRADILLAAEELRARSGVDSVILAGLRIGASLALDLAAQRGDLTGLVLWEPVLDGRRYIEELLAQHTSTITRFFNYPKDHTIGPRPTELLGFALGETMLHDLERVNLRALPQLPPRPILVMDNHDDPALAEFAATLGSAPKVAYRHVPNFAVWVDDVDKGLVPHAVIESITGWLSEAFA